MFHFINDNFDKQLLYTCESVSDKLLLVIVTLIKMYSSGNVLLSVDRWLRSILLKKTRVIDIVQNNSIICSGRWSPVHKI